VRVEQAQSARVGSTTEDVTDMNGRVIDLHTTTLSEDQIMVSTGDGDRSTLRAARHAGIWKKDAQGKWQNTFSSASSRPTEPQSSADRRPEEPAQQDKPQQQQDEAPLKWESPQVDAVMKEVGPLLPSSAMDGLVSLGVTGAMELSDVRAAELAQQIPNASP